MTDLVISENDLQTYDEYVDSLAHHGILGQKWGRKMGPPYPLDSEDHSASEKKAGWRESIEKATSKIREATEAIRNKNKKPEDSKPAQNAPKREETEEERAEREQKYKRAVITSANANVIKDNASKLTTQELREAVDRMNLMAQVDSKVTTPPTIMDKINNAINKADQVATLATKGVDTYNKIAKIYNKFQDPPLPVLDKTAAERAKEATEAAKKAKEEARKELIDKAIRSEDPDKIAKIRKDMTYQELNDFNNRMNAVDTLMKRTKGEKAKEEEEAARKERIVEAAKTGDYSKYKDVMSDIKNSGDAGEFSKIVNSVADWKKKAEQPVNTDSKPDNSSKGSESKTDNSSKGNDSKAKTKTEPSVADIVNSWAKEIDDAAAAKEAASAARDESRRRDYSERLNRMASEKEYNDGMSYVKGQYDKARSSSNEQKESANSQKAERFSGDVVGNGTSSNTGWTRKVYTDDDAVDTTYREVVSQYPALREASTSSFSDSQRASLANKLEDKGLPTYWLLEDKSQG